MHSLVALIPLALVSVVQVLDGPTAEAQTPLGTPWVSIGPVVGSLQQVERSPLNPQLVFAASGARLVRSLDGGASFTEVPLSLATSIAAIEFGDDGVL